MACGHDEQVRVGAFLGMLLAFVAQRRTLLDPKRCCSSMTIAERLET